MTPTHINSTTGTRAARIATAQGEGPEAGKTLVVYLDLADTPPTTHVIAEDLWQANWTQIPAHACPVCHGSGTDQIKRRKDRPCGGCYGLGRVREDGETPADRWELAEVAGRVIREIRSEMAKIERQAALMAQAPGVTEWLEAERARRQQAASDAQARQEREWREGRGHGPGGARMTGD
ncbi:MAG: hypothetical protein ACOC0M_00495 [Halomonas sp.]